MKQQMSSQSGFRNVITCFFMLMALLYLLYSNLLLSNNSKDCPTTNLSLKELSSSNTSDPDPETGTSASAADSPLLHDVQRYDTQLKHVVFGIAASAHFWQNRKEYIKTWWRPKETRGVVWADQKVRARKDEGLPEIRLSEDTSRLKYTNPQGQRAALRISRIVSETLRLGLEDVRWFVMGDDDTVFVVENVVRVLQKYDHTQYYYIGGSSESHVQNIYFSYGMAFGGGGFAISYPLAVALEKMQDRCIDRYPGLFGSDDRMHACMAELGVPLTKEPGFHQYDVNGNLVGLLGAHPLAPLVSLHHIDFVEPVFPNKGRVESLQHLLDSGKLDSASLMQQSICYDTSRYWSISVAWGYVVQVMRGVMSPRELEMPTRTFLNWFRRADFISYAMNTRPVMRHPCEKPFLFYVSKVRYDPVRNQTIGIYYRHKAEVPPCRWRMESPERINSIVVIKSPDDRRWNRPARRDCCKVLPSKKNTSLFVWVGSCQKEEVIEFQETQAA